MGTRNDDISLKLAKAVKAGFLPDVRDDEVDILEKEAKKLFGSDIGIKGAFPKNNFSVLLSILEEAKVSTGITILGDSTGYTAATTRWPDLLALWLANRYPNYTVQMATWDGATKYNNPVVYGDPVNRSVTYGGAKGVMHSGDGTALTGDLYLDIKAIFPVWPVVNGAQSTIVSRWGGAAGRNAFNVFANTSGQLRFQWSADGLNNFVTAPTSSVLPVVANTPIWIRIKLTAATGTVEFFTSPDKTTWTAQGSTVTSATSVFDPGNAQHYGLGMYDASNATYTGATFCEVHIYSSDPQQSVVPRYPDAWVINSTVAATGITFSGKPVLTILNGSWPGSSLTHHDNATNRPRLNLGWHNPAVKLLSLSHNEQFKYGSTYTALWDTFLTNLKAKDDQTPHVLLTQNPKVAGQAYYVDAHARRRKDLIAWSLRNNIEIVDVYRAFLNSDLPLTSLVDSDGIHPSDATGSPLWFETVKDYLMGI